MKIQTAKLFDINGKDSVNDTKMFTGSPSGLIQLNDIKYDWAYDLYQKMIELHWIPQKYDVTGDIADFKELTQDEKRTWEGVISYLIDLDSVQVKNLPYIQTLITAPEIDICLSTQCFFEVIHTWSYQWMLESLYPDKQERTRVYYLWRDDKVLAERCSYIASLYQDFLEAQTYESYFYALIADYILESLYFYNGFAINYNFAFRNKMQNCSDIFKKINQDELKHLQLFQNIIREALHDPIFSAYFSMDKVYEMFDYAVNTEINWINYITNNNVLGITEDSTDCYTKFLANSRLKGLGLKPLYNDDKYKTNVYAHLERLSGVDDPSNLKGNFFDSNITSYIMSSGVDGWDF